MSVRQKPIDPCKVAIYIRWSTEDQSDGTTLDVQMDGCKHYVLSQGWTVQDELTFIDDGYSGGTLDRPGLQRLRSAITGDAVDCVVVFKLDRLSRNVVDTVKLVMEEWEDRCYIKSAREPIDTTSQAGKMFFYTLASFAEWERSVIKDRTFSGKLRRAMEGKNPGFTPPYGYTLGESGSFDVVAHEAEVVKRIYLLYRQGYGAMAIASLLNEMSVPFSNGGLWNQTTIKNILKNPAYTGRLVYGTTTWDQRRRKRNKAEEPHVVRDDVFPVIIPQAEWDQVQLAKSRRPGPANGQSGRSHSSPHLLSGLLRCSQCGQALGGTAGLSERLKYRYYDCIGVRTKGRQACNARRIQQRILDEIVVSHVKEFYATEVARDRYVQHLVQGTAAELGTCRTALQEVEQVLGKVDSRRKHMRALVMDKQVTMAEYREFIADIEAETARLRQRQEELSRSVHALEGARAQQAGLTHSFTDLDKWEELSLVQKKELLRRFIVRIEAFLPRGGHELTCNITWRVPVDTPETEVVQEAPRDLTSWQMKAAAKRK